MKRNTSGGPGAASAGHALRWSIGLAMFLLFATSLSAGQAAPGRSKALLFLQPNASAPAQLLTETESTVVQEYDSQLLISVPGHKVAHLLAVGKKLGLALQVRDEFDMIKTSRGPLNTRLGLAASFPGHPAAKHYPRGTAGVHLLQFIGPVLPAWDAAVRSLGVQPIQYLPLHAFICAGTPEAVAAARNLPFVQFADVMPAFLKPRILSSPGVPVHAIVQIAKSPGFQALLADLERRSSTPIAIRHWSELEIQTTGTFDGGDVEDILTEPLVFGIARVPQLEFSDERAAIFLTRHVVAGQPMRPPDGYKGWLASVCPFCTQLQSDGFWAGIADSGVAGGDTPDQTKDHPDLARTRIKWGFNGLGPPHHHQDGPVTVGEDTFNIPAEGHGTMVAGVLAGNPQSQTDQAGFLFGTGVAPSVGLLVSIMDLRRETRTAVAVLTADALNQNPPVRVQSHSYNEYSLPCTDGTYSLMSRDFDRAVLDGNVSVPGNQPITLVVSAGNQNQSQCHPLYFDPTLTNPPATAKNVIAAGMAENARPEDWLCNWDRLLLAGGDPRRFNNIAANSQRGTRTSGWYKPDLFFPSAGVTSARSPLLTTDWTRFCGGAQAPGPLHLFSAGTSFAAPGVAGAAVLARRVYAEHRNPGCRQLSTCSTPEHAASPALVKAMLILSARSMANGAAYYWKFLGNPEQMPIVSPIGPLPNSQQGFGQANLEDMFSRYPAHAYVDENGDPENPIPIGGIWSSVFSVHDATKPVKIALVWSDPPALEDSEVGTTVLPLVNNLDLSVELADDESCTWHMGNDMQAGADGEVSVTHSSATIPNVACAAAGPFDTLNNVEVIRFATTHPTFRVVVRFANGFSPSQAFAMTMWNAFTDDSPPPAPPVVNSVATSTSAVAITWAAVPSAVSYEVQRRAAGREWEMLAETSTTTFVDSGLPGGSAFLYRARSLRSTVASTWSAPDPATTVVLDGTFGIQQSVRAEHLFDLRRGAAALALLAGIPAPTFSDPADDSQALHGIVVDASHLLELRSCVQQARAVMGLSSPHFSDSVSAGAPIRFDHFDEVWRAFK